MSIFNPRNSIKAFRDKKPLKNKFIVTKKDWLKAKEYFSAHPKQTKLSRKKADIEHSFLKINGQIYALKKGEALGRGAFGKVKIVQDEKGNNFAVKIEGFNTVAKIKERLKQRNDVDDDSLNELIDSHFAPEIKESLLRRTAEIQMMKQVGDLKGVVQIDKDGKSDFLNVKNVDYKTYTLQPLHNGAELRNKLEGLTIDQKLNVALRAINDINELHQNNIIHCDIKPENFLLSDNNDLISIDFGLSKKINGDHVIKKTDNGKPAIEGTPPYISPEISKEGRYSPLSDVYALGILLKEDLKLKGISSDLDNLINKMTSPSYKERPSLENALSTLNQINARISQDQSLLKAKVEKHLGQLIDIASINNAQIKTTHAAFDNANKLYQSLQIQYSKYLNSSDLKIKAKADSVFQQMLACQKQILLLNQKVKDKSSLKEELQIRIDRVNQLKQSHGKDLILLKIQDKVSLNQLEDFKLSLQQRMDTTQSPKEKLALTEIYLKVSHAYRLKNAKKALPNMHILLHKDEVKFLKHKDFTLLMSEDLKRSLSKNISSNTQVAQSQPKLKEPKIGWFKRLINAIGQFFGGQVKAIPKDHVAVNEDKHNAKPSEALLPSQRFNPTGPSMLNHIIQEDELELDLSIDAHNDKICALIIHKLKQTERNTQPMLNHFSHQKHKRNIFKDLLDECTKVKSSHLIINLNEMVNLLEHKYRDTSDEAVLKQLTQNSGPGGLKNLVQSNQQYLNAHLHPKPSESNPNHLTNRF